MHLFKVDQQASSSALVIKNTVISTLFIRNIIKSFFKVNFFHEVKADL